MAEPLSKPVGWSADRQWDLLRYCRIRAVLAAAAELGVVPKGE